MKRILFLILGYYLVIQAGLGAFGACGTPENATIILLISGFCGWGGYKLIIKGRNTQKAIENAPTKELDVPETNRLDSVPKPYDS